MNPNIIQIPPKNQTKSHGALALAPLPPLEKIPCHSLKNKSPHPTGADLVDFGCPQGDLFDQDERVRNDPHTISPEIFENGEKPENKPIRLLGGRAWIDPNYDPYDPKHFTSKPPPRLRYVEACEKGQWTIRYWKEDDPGNITAKRYVCGSWRHKGQCSIYRAKIEAKRILNAIKKHKFGCYLLLTLDARVRKTTFLPDQYKNLVGQWDRLRKRLFRRYGAFKYVTIVERHSDGVPHMNIIIFNEVLWRSIGRDGYDHKRKRFFSYHDFSNQVDACKFGRIYEISRLRSRGKLSWYLVKLQRQAMHKNENIANELTKTCQIPIHAPKHFRRIRSSRRFLEPLKQETEYTGELVNCPIEKVEESFEERCERLGEDRPWLRSNWTRPPDQIKVELGRIGSNMIHSVVFTMPYIDGICRETFLETLEKENAEFEQLAGKNEEIELIKIDPQEIPF